MNPRDLSILEPLLRIAREAGARIRDIYASDFAVEYKGPANPVTEADRIANDLICERLAREFPGVPIVAEESDPATFTGYRDAHHAFYVDPLDGTREFIARNGEFAVMLGVTEANRAVAGVVYSPVQHTAWLGVRDAESFREIDGQSRVQIRAAIPERLSDLVLVSSRTHRSRTSAAARQYLGAGKVQALGSVGLKGAHVAQGTAHAYIAPGRTGKRWDACAIDALLSGAGCRLTDSHGAPLDYRAADLANDRGLLGAPHGLHQRLLDELNRIRAAAAANKAGPKSTER